MPLVTGQDIIVADVIKIIMPAEVNIDSMEPPLSGLQAAAYSVGQSSGAGTIKPQFGMLSFDDSTDEGRMRRFRMPLIGNGDNSIYLHYGGYMAGANTSKTICIAVQLAAVSPGDASMTAKVFAAANSKVKTVPDAAGTYFEDSIELAIDDSVAVGDWVCMVVYRDVSEDDAAGDFNMTQINLQLQP